MYSMYRPTPRRWPASRCPLNAICTLSALSPVPRQECAHLLVHVIDLRVRQAVVAGEQHPAAHHTIGVRVAARRLASLDVREAGLSEDVPGEDGARLDVSLL